MEGVKEASTRERERERGNRVVSVEHRRRVAPSGAQRGQRRADRVGNREEAARPRRQCVATDQNAVAAELDERV